MTPATPSSASARTLPRRIDGVLRSVRSWAEKNPRTAGVLLEEAASGGRTDHFSDLELVLLPSPGTSGAALLDELAAHLPVAARLSKDGIVVLYLTEPRLKVEVRLGRSVAGAPDTVGASDDRNLRALEPIVDRERTGPASRNEADGTRPAGDSPTAAADGTASRFLYYYEALHAALHRSDHLGAFFLYGEAFHELGLFLTAVLSPDAPIDARRRLMDLLDIVDPELRRRFDACAPEWGHDLTVLLLRKELMFDLFEHAADRVPARLSLDRATVRSIREFARDRYPPLIRWRDLGGRGRVAPRRVFRASRLDRYPAHVVRPFLQGEGVRTIVDLRTDKELATHHYPAEVLDGIRYVRIPVWPSLPYSPGASEPQRLNFLYGRTLEDPKFAGWMERFLGELAQPENLPLVIHCWAGADRTGILVATLLDLAGATEEEIVEDYLITSAHVRAEYIEIFLTELRKLGGARKALEHFEVPGALIDAALEAITRPGPPSSAAGEEPRPDR